MSKLSLLILPYAQDNSVILTDSEVVRVHDVNDLTSYEPLKLRKQNIFDEVKISCPVPATNMDVISCAYYYFNIIIMKKLLEYDNIVYYSSDIFAFEALWEAYSRRYTG